MKQTSLLLNLSLVCYLCSCFRPAAVTMRITAGCAHLKKRWCTKAFFHSTAPPPNRGSGLDPTLPLQSRNSHQDNGKHIDLLHPSTGICCTPWWKGILVKLQCSESCKLLNLASLASKNWRMDDADEALKKLKKLHLPSTSQPRLNTATANTAITVLRAGFANSSNL